MRRAFPMAFRPRHAGFTLVEAAVVMVVMCVVLATAGPGMQRLLSTQRVKSLAFDLAADLMLARSEALKRNAAVNVEPASSNWNRGWSVSVPSTSTALRSHGALNEELQFEGAPSVLIFQSNGRLGSPGSQVRMTIRGVDGSADTARCLQLDLSGRVRIDPGVCA